jgi:SAM-dependent methyltransferase
VLLGEQGYKVSGVDLSPRMVAFAREKAARAGIVAEFEVGDAAAPPWPSSSFDVVISRHVLWALPDAGLGLDRWLQLLVPDGQLVLIEGRWWTGGGLSTQDTLALLSARGRQATVISLTNPVYWGGPITDDRYMLVSPPTL